MPWPLSLVVKTGSKIRSRIFGAIPTPVSLTVWAPLDDATPLTSCMYLLPINRDPVYNTENEGKWQIELTAIRALPAERPSAGPFVSGGVATSVKTIITRPRSVSGSAMA